MPRVMEREYDSFISYLLDRGLGASGLFGFGRCDHECSLANLWPSSMAERRATGKPGRLQPEAGGALVLLAEG